ncbi:hypothetical protein [Streptomyces flaveolus]|uniref:hypothetical protein n=1 Tax=Streptomyces flaveolus TaxID=67297 RepID=UPI0037A833F3
MTASARTPAATPGHADAASPAASASPPAPLAASRPVRVRIPAAGVDTGPVLELGLARDGTVQVPSEEQADLTAGTARASRPARPDRPS